MKDSRKHLFDSIRTALQNLTDPERAPEMQRYMKSEMPFYGIPTPVRRKTSRNVFKDNKPWTFEKWTSSILQLWRCASYREERYCAIDLIEWEPSCKKFHTWEAMPMLEEMVITGAWWDYCDNLSRPLGNILRAEPEKMRKLMEEWSIDEDIWKQRSSILCQLRFKEDLDFEFLQKCIEPSIESNEFFLRKAIGWALRDHAWTFPQDVKDYVETNKNRLSGLSKREALKNIHKLL